MSPHIRSGSLALVSLGVLLFSMQPAVAAYTYYHNNPQGSPVAATDQDGQVIWRAYYRPFGHRTQTTASYLASLNNPIWFTGHVHDEPTNLTYMLARYHDPGIGRFLSIDPAPFNAADPQSFNRYSYARNNPYRFVDPDGRESILFSGRAAFSPGGGASGAYSLYITFPLTQRVPFDIGYLSSTAAVAGADISVTAGVSMLTGGRENLEGAFVAVGATVPLTGMSGPAIDAEVVIDPVAGKVIGGGLSGGLSLFPSASVSYGKSQVQFSLRDWWAAGREAVVPAAPEAEELSPVTFSYPETWYWQMLY